VKLKFENIIFIKSIEKKMGDTDKYWVNFDVGVGMVHFKKLTTLPEKVKEKAIGDLMLFNSNMKTSELNNIFIKKQGATTFIPIDFPLLFNNDEERGAYLKLRKSLVFT